MEYLIILGYSFALLAMMNVLYPTKQLICVGENIKEIKINEKYAPLLTVTIKSKENESYLNEIAPFTTDYKIKDKPLYYLCENGVCSPPSENLNIT